MTGWRKRQVVELAREVNAVFDVMAMGRHDGILFTPLELERFAELVRADERGRMCEQLKECSNEKPTSNEANRSAVLGEGG